MDTQPDPARKRASREATEWSILLRDEPDDADLRRRFEDWRAASPLHEQAWDLTQRASDLAAQALPAFAHEWRPQDGKDLAAIVRPHRTRRRWLVPAASLALAAVIAVVAAPVVLLRLHADHISDTAEIRSIALEDGSEVTLAPGSAIAVAFHPGERHVELLKGEAFFTVTPDTARPFRVVADTVETAVLGTRFDVRLDQRTVLVAVEEGTVRVTSVTGREILKAGQSLRVDGTGMRPSDSPELASAWRRGQLYVQNRPLGEAIDGLRRYFAGSIVIADLDLADRPTTGVFNLADPEAALRGMAQAHGAKVRRITPWLLVVSAS
jgi:transmembrane sensor